MLRLHRLEEAGRCQVFYGDESGFCLSPVVPYLWQPQGRTPGLPAKAHSRRLNALGLLSRAGRLHHFETQQKITAEFVIQSIEALLPSLPGVFAWADGACAGQRHGTPLGTGAGQAKVWKQKGLRLLFLPPYCPHLNKIEGLWRMVKYHWLGPEAYANSETLCRSVTGILAQIGTKYRLSFA